MKIAILSDIHDNVWKLRAVLHNLGDCETMFFCGDICSPFMLDIILNGFNGIVHMVFGNNDGDLYRITEKSASQAGKIFLYGHSFNGKSKDGKDLLFDGRKCFLNHYQEIAIPVAKSQEFDLVCYGHNHKMHAETIGKTLLLNPGAVMGYQPQGHIEIPSTFMKYDTTLHHASAFQVAENDIVIPYSW